GLQTRSGAGAEPRQAGNTLLSANDPALIQDSLFEDMINSSPYFPSLRSVEEVKEGTGRI
ncbi:MAG: hypothetical protein AAB427_06630, partial [Chloroflexota bacterium]